MKPPGLPFKTKIGMSVFPDAVTVLANVAFSLYNLLIYVYRWIESASDLW